MSLRLSDGCLIETGERIGSGGEGSVHRIRSVEGRVVKLYGEPKGERAARKLRALAALAHSRPLLQRHVALPIDLVFRGAELAGFVMPLVVAKGPIDEFIHPVEREGREKLVSFRDLVGVGLKLTQAAQEIHAAGLVIGDVNESNVLIREDGSSCFLDADSFQVTANGEVFTCPVAKELFLPPELQGTPFETTQRNPNHDAFGIAVLLFQLLMNGRHPFVGIPKDGSECHIHERIMRRDYAYRSDGASTMVVPPGVASASMLGVLSGLFERAFLSGQRPTMAEWSAALRAYGDALTPCSSRNPRHFQLPSIPTCPFCALPRDPYPADAPTDRGELDDLQREVVELERSLTAVQRRLAVPSLAELTAEEKTLANFGSMPIARARASIRSRRVIQIVSCLLVIPIGILVAKWTHDDATGVFAGVATALVGLVLSTIRTHSSTTPAMALRAAAEWTEVVARFDEVLRNARQELARIPTPHGELSSIRQMATVRQQKFLQLDRSLEGPENAWRATWRQDRLRSFRIDDAQIADIGVDRKRVLRSHGIITAFELEEPAIRSIPGFGPHLTLRLMSWKRHREQEVDRLQIPPMPREFRTTHEMRHNASYAQILRNDRSTLQAMKLRVKVYRASIAPIMSRVDHALQEARAIRHRLAEGRSS